MNNLKPTGTFEVGEKRLQNVGEFHTYPTVTILLQIQHNSNNSFILYNILLHYFALAA